MNPVVTSVLQLLRQFVLVAVGFFVLFSFFQCSLSLTNEQGAILTITGTSQNAAWSHSLNSLYQIQDNQETTQIDPKVAYQRYYSCLKNSDPQSTISVRYVDQESQEKLVNIKVGEAQTQSRFSVDNKTLNASELEQFIASFAHVTTLAPTEQVSIADLKRNGIRTPTRSKVSLPDFPYRQAFPHKNDSAEYTINSYKQSPLIEKRCQLNPQDPDYLPPVEHRLPRNPAVVWGPDGIGQYGGDWRQCTSSHRHINTKMCTESFTRFDPSGNIQPCLAYKWDISDDLRTYTFHLRKGHKWSNGEAFTSHDIAYVCNVDIGSQRWSTYPDWMQATDGSKYLSILDVKDWEAFKAYLLSNDAFAAYIKKQLSTLNFDIDKILSLPDFKDAMISALNTLCAVKDFYNEGTWPTIDIQTDLSTLQEKGLYKLNNKERTLLKHYLIRNDSFSALKKGDNIDDDLIIGLNNMLLRKALSQYLREPIIDRVVVSPVADANGDDSHIIRFTFPRPNPLFLERTATFMFYRGLFGMPEHFYSPYHYLGTQELDYFDILKWEAFTDEIQIPGNQQTVRFWNALDSNTQDLIKSYTQETDKIFPIGNEQQKAIVAGIRKALKQQVIFPASELKSLNPERLLNSISAEHLRSYNLSEWNRYYELQQLASIGKEILNGKSSDLSPLDISYFNTMCFRLAFDHKTVAISREHGLNHIAGHQHKPYRTWVARLRDFGTYHPDYNPHPPVLQAWRIITPALDRTMIAERNPYYYRVDIEGNQLPYLDRVVFQIEKEEQVRLLKLASGNVDFQTRDLNSNHWSILKAKEHDGGYRIIRWANDYNGELNFYTLQTNKDEHIGKILQDKRFRYALSLGLNRQEMIDVFWQGLGSPAQCSVPEGSPYYSAKHEHFMTDYDVDKANAYLDDLGLNKRGNDGVRRLPNGEPLILNVHSRYPHFNKVIQMACNYWQQLGINAQMKLASGPAINRSLSIGTLEIGVQDLGDSFFGPLLPARYAPSHPAECPQWFSWVQWYHSNGKGGIEPTPQFKQRKALWDKIIYAQTRESAFQTWAQLQEMTRDELPYIGVTSSPGQVVYIKNGFKNVPRLAMSGWIAHQPGNCCPEVFYKEQSAGDSHAD